MNQFPESHDATTTPVDPQRVLETLVTELENLTAAAPDLSAPLTELYGALLAHAIEGRVDLLPEVAFGVGGRQRRERRVARIARRIVRTAGGDAAVALQNASALIEQRLHLIDPELSISAA